MIKVENVSTWGFEHAIRGMRNPMNSWDKSDSVFCDSDGCGVCEYFKTGNCDTRDFGGLPDVLEFDIGKRDLNLMKRLFMAGVEHRTYARMIMVSMDIDAPLYWWKEMDRYTVGKTQISTSTMHKIHTKEFTLDDFSVETLYSGEGCRSIMYVIEDLNEIRKLYNETKDKKYWYKMIQLLPSSYNQKRTVMMSYETVFKIIKERKGHKLDEWNDFVEILEKLPYVKEIMGEQYE